MQVDNKGIVKSRQARKKRLPFTCLTSARCMHWQHVSGRQSRNALLPSYEPGQFQSILPSSWMETDDLQPSKACGPSQATSKAISRCHCLSLPCTSLAGCVHVRPDPCRVLQLLDALQWCLNLGVEAITVYAFSIDNFRRDPREVAALMCLAEEKLLDLLCVRFTCC